MIKLETEVPLAPLTTFGVGGAADYFFTFNDLTDLPVLLSLVKERGLAVRVLGGGSNVVVADGGIKALVLKNELTGHDFTVAGSEVYLRVRSGEIFDQVVAKAVQRGYWGLENLSAIPGSVGATPIQNVGAYGIEVADLITEVRAVDLETGTEKAFTNDDCQFSYRNSFFKTKPGRKFFVTEVTYRLNTVSKPQLGYRDLDNYFTNKPDPSLKSIREAIIKIRGQKFPDWRQLGTAGSFFKNPIVDKDKAAGLKAEFPELPLFEEDDGNFKISLSWIMDNVLALKGYRKGNVGTYKDHVLVMVNYGGAKFAEVISLAKEIETKVFDRTGIKVEWEVTKLE